MRQIRRVREPPSQQRAHGPPNPLQTRHNKTHNKMNTPDQKEPKAKNTETKATQSEEHNTQKNGNTDDLVSQSNDPTKTHIGFPTRDVRTRQRVALAAPTLASSTRRVGDANGPSRQREPLGPPNAPRWRRQRTLPPARAVGTPQTRRVGDANVGRVQTQNVGSANAKVESLSTNRTRTWGWEGIGGTGAGLGP